MKMRKTKFKDKKFGGIIFGCIAAIISMAALATVFALILSRTENPFGLVGAASLATLILSSLLSSFFTVKFKPEGGIISALFSLIIISLMLLAVGLCASGFSAIGGILLNIVIYLSVGMLTAYLASRKKTKHHKFRH